MRKILPKSIICATVLVVMTSVFAYGQTPTQRRNIWSADPPKPQAAGTARTSTGLDYVTSWIGNSLPGNSAGPAMPMRHVQLDIGGIYVTPSGLVYANQGWDEGGRSLSVYSNGKLISPMTGNAGGPAVAVSGGYIYASQSTGCPSGCGVEVLNAATYQNTGLQLSGGNNIYSSPNIFGLAVANGNLYVSEWDFNAVEIYNLNTLQWVNTIPVTNPVRLAADSQGGVWVSHRDPTQNTNSIGEVYDLNEMWGLATIDHYDSSGNYVNTITLPNEADGSTAEVGAIAVTPTDELLVADNGRDLNIKIYSNITTAPTLSGTFGVLGGIYSGDVPGLAGPLRLRSMNGVGEDAAGNIYVVQSGAGLDLSGGEPGHGIQIQSYTSAGVLNWELHALEWISLATVDPQSEADVYDAFHHYKMNYTKGPGQEATYYSDTYDRFTYYDDIRVTVNTSGNGMVARGEIHYLNGKKFLCVYPQGATWMAMYRFDPYNSDQEIPTPSVVFDYGSWYGSQDLVYEPPINDNDTEFIWRDTSGDGHIADGTFYEPSGVAPFLKEHRDGENFFVDTNGDVWQINYATNQPPYEPSIHIRRYQFQGLDSNGVPIYDFNHVTLYSVPTDFPDFSQVGNMAFYPAMSNGGTLFVMGQNAAAGAPAVARYDGWDTGNRTSTFVSTIPWQANTSCPSPNTWAPTQFTVGGGFYFVDFWCPHYNLVYNASTGAYVGEFIPGANVGGPNAAGDTDMSMPNFAYQRSSGEMLLFQEEDYQAKTLMFRWTPPATLPTPPPAPTAPSGLQSVTADDEVLNVTWTLGSDPHIVSYQLSWSPTSGGPYTVLQSGVAPPSSPINFILQQNGTWYFVLQAQGDTGSYSAYSNELAATTIPYGTTYEAESGALTGCAQIYPGQEDSAGLRVGCMTPASTITLSNVMAPATGTYHVRLYYGNGDSNSSDIYTMGISVNGGAIIYSPTMPFTGDWSIPGYVYMDLPLNAGANTLVIENPVNGGPDIDRIVVPAAPEGSSLRPSPPGGRNWKSPFGSH